jgi:metal-responsive CopG/Arc/MetJ family transcriptional regulator
MSKLIAVRLQEKMLSEIERERKRAGLTRTAAIAEALRLWVANKRHEEAIRQDQEGYRRIPVADDEFQSVLGAQVWPK